MSSIAKNGESIDMPHGRIIENKYLLGDKINTGSFATVFQIKTIGEKEFTKVVKIARSTETNEKYNNEVLILKCCLGENCFPQIFDHYSIKKFKYIVMSDSGEAVADILSRNPRKMFRNSNVLRLTSSIFRALDILHRLGFYHRDIQGYNLMMKLTNGHLVFNLIDFGNSATEKSCLKCHYNSTNTSLNVMKTKVYGPIDDYISTVYYMNVVAGFQPFDTRHQTMIEAKEKYHLDPCSLYDPKQQWMGHVLSRLVKIQKDQSKDHKSVRMILDSAIPNCHPTSPIVFKIIEKKVVIE
ncbi:hypothetical protein GCK72_022710 [Caenorhabditis remanei]|uniref:Protein kinase domain-containing protein n=1 Tax=Caenorhabditis remanei TaxID=31234 RepID=A0A6A5FUI5_CAERE|nr:hypothetical protein GCK72_022705 [Caenorhabditis remanei]XP_053578577.1 hypothetical protein GCK72_022710 [Caenorhabditis remanei]KAF1746252.1 hypothetical protein GCK72_022705 [Caenorhabditis remanei]KAF1746257.1 hypothetical protein GCK72_022710 [Caenorhabditis remanei]